MPILPPTVHERLARCGTRVYVSGLIIGADVVLSVNGVDHHHTATNWSHTFVVPPLGGAETVTAKQDDSGFSNDSPSVIVEDVDLPPAAIPQLPGQVGWCSHCVLVSGCVPGCEVELMQGSTTVGIASANRNGAVCMGVKLERRDEEKVGVLSGRMIVCGQPGPLTSTSIVNDPPLGAPLIGSPLFGCQRIVPLSQLHRGSRIRLETDTGTQLGSFCSCWNAVNVRVPHELVVTESVHAQPYWDNNLCKEDGPWSGWRNVEEPDQRIKPALLPALVENDQLIRVDNQISGAELRIVIRDSETSPEQEFGPRPANDTSDLEIALANPLRAGQQVSVVQELCGHKERSEWVTVLPLPPVVIAPVVLPPLYACAGSVQVSNLHPGATVRVYQDGFVVGIGWSGMNSSVSIPTNPGLVAGKKVHAMQWVGGVPSHASDPPVTVQALTGLHLPRILDPVSLGENRVWVSGVSPGALVSIRSGETLLGEALASEPLVSVAVNNVPGTVEATVRLCEQTAFSAPVKPIVGPDAPGPFPGSGSTERNYLPDFPVSPNADGGGYDHPISGRFYYPADAAGNYHVDAVKLPLVVVAHGYWDPLQNSYLGYSYLGHHLARWGMFVYSLNFDRVNEETSIDELQQISRGGIILEAVRRVLADPDLSGRIDPERIGLVGHSMAGEGVVVAQDLNVAAGSSLGIRGVVSIAPTHYKSNLALEAAKYLQLFGSKDQLLSTLSDVTSSDAKFGGFRIYDRAERPKTHFWIYDARHNGFNTEWFNGLNIAEPHLVDISLGLDDHKRIATSLINAFFQDALKDQSEYAGYLQGIILPRSVRAYDIFTQHQPLAPSVIDDFGDADPQLGYPAETPIEKTKNRVSPPQEAKAEGLGLDVWDDVEHLPLAHSVHETRSLKLSWTETDVTYRSDTGGLALSPTQSLSLRVSQFYEDAANNFEGQDLDFFIALNDGAEEAVVRLGLVASAPYPDAAAQVLTVLRTGRLPLDTFEAVNPALNLAIIKRVRFLFMARGSGHVLVDNLEFLP